ncbi:hypothetical protein SDC9_126291 [bioreactor metagenome]|uniref:Uncharacterized protein n=1 Tax=bioreactor metagenome TaxID=1076179 RepID=A0A645CQS9_9ZZZZ
MGEKTIIAANAAGHWSASGRDSGINHMGNTAEAVARIMVSILHEFKNHSNLGNKTKTKRRSSGPEPDDLLFVLLIRLDIPKLSYLHHRC